MREESLAFSREMVAASIGLLSSSPTWPLILAAGVCAERDMEKKRTKSIGSSVLRSVIVVRVYIIKYYRSIITIQRLVLFIA
jgi:hypothetical protein